MPDQPTNHMSLLLLLCVYPKTLNPKPYVIVVVDMCLSKNPEPETLNPSNCLLCVYPKAFNLSKCFVVGFSLLFHYIAVVCFFKTPKP
jgi:hypothetical protein